MAPLSARGVALAGLWEWRRGRQFADAIIHRLLARSGLSAADRAFANELFHGVLRNLTLLDFWLGRLRSAALDHDARDLLRLGLYQLFILETPGHAAVFETVELAPRSKRKLINGVLRAALRQTAELRTAGDAETLAVRFSHPEFLLERWRTAFGAEATRQLCEWDNAPAPVYARVNRLKTTLEQFTAEHRGATPVEGKKSFVRVENVPTEALQHGECYIQDPSTSVACELLAPQPEETVLDACAAPGGKTTLLAELMQNTGRIVACDRDPVRLKTLRDNVHRLGATNVDVLQQDWIAEKPIDQLRLQSFDKILLDAPCTNTGVMRRRVDVRWRLRPLDFAAMQKQQIAILRSVIPLLKPGGTLVYSTCSIDADENEAVVASITQDFPELTIGEQLSVLPFRDRIDGAFAARLVRRR